MEINELKNKVTKVVKERYPNEYKLENRYVSLVQQVAGLGEELEYSMGNREKSKQHDTPQQLISCVMIDLFMLAENFGADLQEELEETMYWFKNGEHTSRYKQKLADYKISVEKRKEGRKSN